MTYDLHSDLSRVAPSDLGGFFSGWPTAPSPETHHRLLAGSTHFVVAVPRGGSQVAGYITALSDGGLSSYISHLEVLPTYRRQGIGSRLVRTLIDQLDGIYMVDLTCDADVQPFYQALGLQPSSGMIRRNYGAQGGLPIRAAR